MTVQDFEPYGFYYTHRQTGRQAHGQHPTTPSSEIFALTWTYQAEIRKRRSCEKMIDCAIIWPKVRHVKLCIENLFADLSSGVYWKYNKRTSLTFSLASIIWGVDGLTGCTGLTQRHCALNLFRASSLVGNFLHSFFLSWKKQCISYDIIS